MVLQEWGIAKQHKVEGRVSTETFLEHLEDRGLWALSGGQEREDSATFYDALSPRESEMASSALAVASSDPAVASPSSASDGDQATATSKTLKGVDYSDTAVRTNTGSLSQNLGSAGTKKCTISLDYFPCSNHLDKLSGKDGRLHQV